MVHPLDIIGLKKHAGLHGPYTLDQNFKTRPELQNVTEGRLTRSAVCAFRMARRSLKGAAQIRSCAPAEASAVPRPRSLAWCQDREIRPPSADFQERAGSTH